MLTKQAEIEFEGWIWHLTNTQNPVKSYVVLTKEKLVMFYHGVFTLFAIH